MSPARRRACVDFVVAEHGVSERFACRVLGQHRSTQRKVAVLAEDEAALTGAIVALALQYGRYGYRRITDRDGTLREDLPPMTTFLNRLLALPISLQDSVFAVFEVLLEAKIEGAIAAGIYDRGVETVTADSLRIVGTHPLATHAATGAETCILTLACRNRNRPLTLAEALERGRAPRARLLVNAQSGRAAVQVPAPSWMDEAGAVIPRVRLLRPLEREGFGLEELARSHWQPAEPAAFAAAWGAECAALPEFRESTLHVVTGLLLPVWQRLPQETCRVVRLQTDDGQRLIGRLVPADWVAAALPEGVASPSEAEAWAALQRSGGVVQLADGLALRRFTVMNAARIELTGFTDGWVERLKAIGLFGEIIAWKLRLFVPVGEDGPAILSRLVTYFPMVRLAARAAA